MFHSKDIESALLIRVDTMRRHTCMHTNIIQLYSAISICYFEATRGM